MIGSMCQLRECRSIRARRFWASLLPHTTCMRSWCNWRASCVAASQFKKTRKSSVWSVFNTQTKKQVCGASRDYFPPPLENTLIVLFGLLWKVLGTQRTALSFTALSFRWHRTALSSGTQRPAACAPGSLRTNSLETVAIWVVTGTSNWIVVFYENCRLFFSCLCVVLWRATRCLK